MMARLDRDVAARRPSVLAELVAEQVRAFAADGKRTAQTVGTTTGTNWADDVVQTAFPRFLASLAPLSAAARLFAGAVPVDLGRAGKAEIPQLAADATPLSWVAESAPIPVHVGDFELATLAAPKKLGGIVPLTAELAKRADSVAIVDQLLREALARGLDGQVFGSQAASASAVAGLLNGVTATPSMQDLQDDLEQLGTIVSATGGSGRVLFIMSPDRAVRLRIRAPQVAATLDFVGSAAIAAGTLAAVDPLAVLHFVETQPDIMVAAAGVVHMSDTPLEIVSDTGPTAADPGRGLWQTASMAIRILFDATWAKRRATAAAITTDIDAW